MSTTVLETLPLPQRLALSYAPRSSRDEVLALLALNVRLSGIVRQQGEPVIAQMKLAWWRDRFMQEKDGWPVGEPLLALLAQWRGNLRLLGHLVDGWEGLLAETLGRDEIHQFAQGHAMAWSGLTEHPDSGTNDASLRTAAKQWALADLAMHLSDESERKLVLAALADLGEAENVPGRSVRPLVVLRGLTMRALERGGGQLLEGPGDMATALRLGVLGR